MKKSVCVFLGCALLCYGNSQIPYYTTKAMNDSLITVSGNSFTFKTDSNVIKRLSGYLKSYLSEDLIDSNLNANQVFAFYIDNPFLGNQVSILIAGANPPIAGTVNKIFSSIPGLPITNFADGAAKFLVKRFKEELSIAFFQKFKDEISKVEELRILFPQTYKVLLVINTDIYKFSAYLNTLRECFIKDLTNLYTDFKRLTQLDKYQKYFKVDHPEAYTIIINSLYLIDQYSRGRHPGEAIEKYDVKDLLFSNPSLQHNMRSSFSLLKAFSTSFKSLSPDHYWVPADSMKMMLEDPITRNIYFGLLYQKYGAISFFKNKTDSIRFDDLLAKAREQTNQLKDSLNEYVNYIETLSDHAQEVSEYLSSLKKKEKETIDYNDYYKLYNASFDLLEYSLTFIDLPYVNPDDTLENNIHTQSNKWIYVARNTGELYVDVRTKNYSSAILNVTGILDTVLHEYHDKDYVDQLYVSLRSVENKLDSVQRKSPGKVSGYTRKLNKAKRKFSKDEDATMEEIHEWLNDKKVTDQEVIAFTDSVIFKKRELKASGNHLKLKSTILKYGSFASSVAQAQNSDEVEKAIESIALPAGSASIKKNSSFNIALNAYLGGFYGNEFLKESPGKKWAPITGIYAPIGVTVSTPVHFLFKKPGSLSAFFSAIDIGAFASFRLGDDTTKALPEISLKNIFAPGAGIVYGFPKLPLSLGWTWQYGPMLREINRKDNDININASNRPNHRWQFFLAVDIPIVNFYNKSK